MQEEASCVCLCGGGRDGRFSRDGGVVEERMLGNESNGSLFGPGAMKRQGVGRSITVSQARLFKEKTHRFHAG